MRFPSLSYIQNYGKNNLALFVIFYVISIAVNTFAYYAFKQISLIKNMKRLNLDNNQLVYLWSGLIIFVSLLQFVYQYALASGSIRTSKRIHTELLTNFKNWTIESNEDYLSGEIVNVFSRDLNTYDNKLFTDILRIINFSEIMVFMLLILSINDRYFIIVGIIVLAVFFIFQVIYYFY